MIMVATLIVNLGISTYESRIGKRLDSAILISDAKHTRSDCYITIGVLVGLVLMLLGLPSIVDGIVGFVVVGFIFYGAYEVLTNNINLFCDIVTQRSGEHSCAINILLQQQLYGQVISILRQELDSMVRVMFLLSISDLNLREHFINQTLEGIKWSYPNTKKVVTDKQMVDLADKFYGWPFFVYKLGCAFIHLSAMVYYKNSNPFLLLSVSERNDITRFLHQYHSFPLELELNLENIIPYLDKVFNKVSSNLACYIEDLRQNKLLEEY